MPTKKTLAIFALLSAFAVLGWHHLETGVAAALPSAALQQCSNHRWEAAQECTGDSWVNGNLNKNKSFYEEGDSVPYRLVLSDLTVGSTNVATIEWDTTERGMHAIDYLTSYDRTETVGDGNDPCADIVPACGAQTTFPIPIDPNVTAAGVTQIAGQLFTMWGGTITSVSAYTLRGSYSDRSSTRISITFTANTSNPVLAWGGHLATEADWATLGGSAGEIMGSPYHTRFVSLNGKGGNQDRAVATQTNPEEARIIIIKQAAPESAQVFGFSTVGLSPGNFTLVDDGIDNDATPNNITFNNLAAGAYTVFETVNGVYDLVSITCSVQPGGTSTSAPNVPAATVNITMQEGDTVTCTFFNAVATP
jgi:hypothetical protein